MKTFPAFLTGFLLLYFLHQDFWFWNDATLFFGLPVGLVYHVLYCVVVTLFFALAAKALLPKSTEG